MKLVDNWRTRMSTTLPSLLDDVAGVKSQGVLQVLTDPRTTVSQCLSAILTIELEDNDAWEMLIELTRKAGHPNIASEFENALKQEQQHLPGPKGPESWEKTTFYGCFSCWTTPQLKIQRRRV
jgi:hypothetical protein